MRGLVYSLIPLGLLIASCATAPTGDRSPSSTAPQEFAAQKLREKGASEDFIKFLIRTYREDQRRQVIELNVLGFLKAKPPLKDGGIIPGWEIKHVKKFIQKNKKIFGEAEKRYRVPREVIASLLWVETRHGKDTGRFHVPSAYFSLVQGEYPTIVNQTIEAAHSKAENVNSEVEAKITERLQRKSAWAAD